MTIYMITEGAKIASPSFCLRIMYLLSDHKRAFSLFLCFAAIIIFVQPEIYPGFG